MKIYIFFLIAISFSANACCQQSNESADLFKRLKTESDTTLVNTMNEVAAYYADRQMFDSDHYYMDKILEISTKNKFQKGLCIAYNGLGIIAMVKGEYKKAMEYYFEGLKIADKNGIKKYIMLLNSNIASVHITQEEYGQAIPILKEVIRMATEKKDTLRIFPLITELGFCFHKDKKNDSAVVYYEKGMALCNTINPANLSENRFNQFVQAKSTALETTTAYYLSTNEPQKALANLLPFWEQIRSSKLVLNQLTVLNSIADTYLKLKEYNNVIHYADMGIASDTGRNYPETLQVLFNIKAEASYKTGRFKEAYENYKVYTALKDSLYSAEKFNAIKELQVKYDTEKKEQKIITLDKEKGRNDL